MDPLLGLPITLPQRGSGALLVALHAQLRAAILDGRLGPGARLPSTRELAQSCGVSRNTAVAAYDLLLSEGYVEARRGSGTVVAGTLPALGRRTVAAGAGLERRLNRYWRGRGAAPRPEAAAPPYLFRVGVPDAASFPDDLWRRLRGRVERRMQGRREPAADPQGLAALREAVARHVAFARAVACSPADIVITAGAQQAFDLLARVLVTPGRTTVAVEEPGYPPLRAALAAHGARIAPVAVDADGLLVGRIPRAARVVCVTPSHQFPLGAVMSAARRAALLELCRRQDAVVIEDDYDCEFRFAARPLDALQTLDRAGRVFYVGTFSKSLSPDLRLGYVVAPPWALAALVAAKQVADAYTSTTLQTTVAQLIQDGHLARHVRRMQRLYERRRSVLLDGLAAELSPWLEPLPSAAGLHVTARLAAGRDEQSVILRARQAGVGVSPLRPCFATVPSLAGLAFGYGDIDERHIVAGLRQLRGALRHR